MPKSLRESYSRGMKAEKKHGGEKVLDRVDIREADNGGFIVRCSYHMKKKGDGENMPTMSMGYEDTEKVYESLEGVQELLDDLFGD